MDDQTRIMDEGTAIYPLDPALAAADESCPHCQAVIPVGDQFCPGCGYQRDTWAAGGTDEAEEASVVVAVDARFALNGAEGLSCPLPDGESIAGRSDDADITVSDGYISRRHASFVVDGDSVVLTDLGSANGTFIGESRLDAGAAHELAVGTVLKLGQTELTLAAVEPPVEETAPADAETPLTAEPPEEIEGEPVSGDLERVGMLADIAVEVTAAAAPWALRRVDEDEEFFFPFGATELGRKPGKCDTVIRGDGYISGKHARLLVSLEHLEVIDLGSTNGTFVNGERAVPDQVVELQDGDTLRLGQTDLAVVFEAPEDAVTDAAVELDGAAAAEPTEVDDSVEATEGEAGDRSAE